MEQEMIHMMIKCLTEGESSRMTACGRRHDAIIARFEQYLEAHPDAPLHVVEICAAIGTAERTLRAACEEHLGMGPIRYLNLRRMHLVRRALARADVSRATVTRLATDHGFSGSWGASRSRTARCLESPLRKRYDDRQATPARSHTAHRCSSARFCAANRCNGYRPVDFPPVVFRKKYRRRPLTPRRYEVLT
jgi:AraC-like DNA-binding protein